MVVVGGGGEIQHVHHCTNYSQIKLNFADLWSVIPTKINHLTNCCGNVLPHQSDSHGWSVHHSGQGCGQVWGWLKFEFVLRTTYRSSAMSQLCARPTQSTTGILTVRYLHLKVCTCRKAITCHIMRMDHRACSMLWRGVKEMESGVIAMNWSLALRRQGQGQIPRGGYMGLSRAERHTAHPLLKRTLVCRR